jgi:hypothetical protein
MTGRKTRNTIAPDRQAGVAVDEGLGLQTVVHEMLKANEGVTEERSVSALFEALVAINRANGISPNTEEPVGDVRYNFAALVPMQGDPYWEIGKTISREQINQQFRDLAI